MKDEIAVMKKQVKQYIDAADEKVVKMVHAMLEAHTDEDWWSGMPASVKADLEAALKDSAQGKVIPHAIIQQRNKKWLTK
jgi:CTP:molybdopterin cytidylyltransferase MocA